MSDLSYHEKCVILNSNPVTVARHFQYRVELFSKLIVIDGPLGKSKYYAIRVKFQVRGSPHIHSFIWIIGAPKFSMENIDEYIELVDPIISKDLPDPVSDPALYELVKTYQAHHQMINADSILPVFWFFIACPLSTGLTSSKRKDILNKRNEILKVVS